MEDPVRFAVWCKSDLDAARRRPKICCGEALLQSTYGPSHPPVGPLGNVFVFQGGRAAPHRDAVPPRKSRPCAPVRAIRRLPCSRSSVAISQRLALLVLFPR